MHVESLGFSESSLPNGSRSILKAITNSVEFHKSSPRVSSDLVFNVIDRRGKGACFVMDKQ